ncbi:DNA-binding protein [Pseudomonas sp. V1]|nr:DNA-binding protein [Pseudomonas arcuscaelestis]
MSRSSISNEQAREARDLLLSQGKTDSVRNMQAVLSRGSNTTINRLLRELREEDMELLGERGRIKTELQQLVSALHDKLKESSDLIVSEGQRRADERVAEIEEKLKNEQAAHKATAQALAEAQKDASLHKGLLAEATGKLNSANIELRGVSQALSDTKDNLAEEKRRNTTLNHELTTTRDSHKYTMDALSAQRTQEQKSFENSLTAVRSDLGAANNRIIELTTDLEQQRGVVSARDLTLANMSEKISTLSVAAGKAADAQKAAEGRAMTLEVELATVRTKLEEAGKQLVATTDERRQAQTDLMEARMTINSQAQDLQRLQAEGAQLREQVAALAKPTPNS